MPVGGETMMTTSTTQMLRVMGASVASEKAGDTQIEVTPEAKNLAEKKRQLTPSNSMADVLKCCLSPGNGFDSTPLK